MSTISEMNYRYGVSIAKQIEEFRKRAGENGDLGFEAVTEDLHLVVRKYFEGLDIENKVEAIQSDGWRKLTSPKDKKRVLTVYYKEDYSFLHDHLYERTEKDSYSYRHGEVMYTPPTPDDAYERSTW